LCTSRVISMCEWAVVELLLSFTPVEGSSTATRTVLFLRPDGGHSRIRFKRPLPFSSNAIALRSPALS
jgi:hypothetical protein